MTDEKKKPKPLVFRVMDAPADWLGVNFTDKAVLQALIGHLNQKRNGTEVWPSNERLAILTGGSIDTIRRSKLRLQEKGLIKIRKDSGKSDLCTIHTDEILRRLDPSQFAKGQQSDPSQFAKGTPGKLPGDPSQIATRIAKGTAKGNNQPDIPPLGCSSTSKVTDGDHQRKLALLGVVAGVTDKLRIPDQEQPTKKKTEEASGLASGTLAVNERLGSG